MRQSPVGESLSSVDQRTISQSLTEFTSSYSAGTLSGVVVLENGYDEKEREAWVVVGLSEKTMAAAKATQGLLDDTQRASSGTSTAGPAAERPKSLIRRGNQDF